jgi:NAD(P)-dependent dehydrogenase (short-subunit alcohol dehydrogenase family)
MQRSLLVTGGARGLGASVARAAARRAYRVLVLDLDRTGAEAIAREIDGEPIVASISDTATIERALDGLGWPDVLVNNAGIVRFGPLIDLDAGDWRAVVDINLTGTFLLSQLVARHWIASGTAGAIVNITSMNGVAPGPNAGAYGSTKAAIALLTQQMAIEWGAHGIRVNAVAPGLIDAGMSEPIYADPATRHARESKVPLGRLGVGDDVAQAVLFLASPEASYITGQNVLVDGGVTMAMIANLPRPKSVDQVGHSGD